MITVYEKIKSNIDNIEITLMKRFKQAGPSKEYLNMWENIIKRYRNVLE